MTARADTGPNSLRREDPRRCLRLAVLDGKRRAVTRLRDQSKIEEMRLLGRAD